jgi:hypothetical protein
MLGRNTLVTDQAHHSGAIYEMSPAGFSRVASAPLNDLATIGSGGRTVLTGLEIAHSLCHGMAKLHLSKVPCQIRFAYLLSLLLILLEIGSGRADKAEVSGSSPLRPTHLTRRFARRRTLRGGSE